MAGRADNDGIFQYHRQILLHGSSHKKPNPVKADYLFRYSRSMPISVVVAKEEEHAPSGSADRCHTLELNEFDAIQESVLDFKLQCWSDKIYQRVEAIKQELAGLLRYADAFLTAGLERAFRGKLLKEQQNEFISSFRWALDR